MTKANNIQEQHTAGPIAIGFDYQFYLFMYLALELEPGEKIGFEVKDDIHIDKADGTTILFQAKHTVQHSKNLTTLDSDLWKTLSNWVDFIKAEKDNLDFLNKHWFILTTNKSDNNNDFLSSLLLFKIDNEIDAIYNKLRELKNSTTDKKLKKYIQNVISIGKKKLKIFLTKLTIDTDADGIIAKIKNQILKNTRQEKEIVEVVYNSLYSNLQSAKYIDIKDRKKFEISFKDFNKRFGGCFKVAFENRPLPKRKISIPLPENIENQIFIKQLIEIGDIKKGSNKIVDYTSKMLQVLNHFSYWLNEGFVYPTEMEEFEQNSIEIWENAFIAKYRQIERKIDSGDSIGDLEDDIQSLGIDLIDFIREKDLSLIQDRSLGIEFSNGHFYALSDELKIGWHFDWENKYKK
tara:strand:+ start:20660 stop:21877 length:1218 start_codon:yes stop_codon:yes gene_type:complete